MKRGRHPAADEAQAAYRFPTTDSYSRHQQ